MFLSNIGLEQSESLTGRGLESQQRQGAVIHLTELRQREAHAVHGRVNREAGAGQRAEVQRQRGAGGCRVAHREGHRLQHELAADQSGVEWGGGAGGGGGALG